MGGMSAMRRASRRFFGRVQLLALLLLGLVFPVSLQEKRAALLPKTVIGGRGRRAPRVPNAK